MDPLLCLDEGTIAGFVEGRLATRAIATVELHASGCPSCQDLLAAALRSATLPEVSRDGDRAVSASATPSPDLAPLVRGRVMGRYTILALKGRGATGEVYAAYDGELDRRVALKLLHARAHDGDSRAQARLLREARAMAKVSHPNVAAVHDAGTFAGRVFIAMEFVDGPTLKEWLDGGARSRGDLLEKFVMAARGLAAAHAVGLVHRDFKPQNVMIAPDGTARVVDFGLVMPLGGRETDTAAPAMPAGGAPTELHLTRTGELLGTPLYMAPEQFRAEPADARTDQFALCVALYQALYGSAPFGDVSLAALVADVLAGNLRAPPGGSRVPAWLRRVVTRGLSVQADARWPTMRDLITALESDPARAWRRRGLVATASLLLALSGVALVRRPAEPSAICRGGPAALAGVWETSASGAPAPARRETVRAAFLASGAPDAAEVWERVSSLLDRYAVDWLAMYRDACEATHVRKQQSAAALDLRMACVDERRTALQALTDVLGTADRGVVASATDAVNALPPLERCADLRQLRLPVEAPRNEATRARVDDLRKRLARTKALNDAGKHAEAKQLASTQLAEARTLGYRPLVAEVLVMLGNTSLSGVYTSDTIAVEEEAVWIALSASRDDLAAEAAVLSASLASVFASRPVDAQRWEMLAEALLERAGDGNDRTRSWLLHGQAIRCLEQKNPREALAFVQRAIALKEKILPPDHPDIAMSLNTEAEALLALGRKAEALAINERVCQIFVRAYGAGSSEAAFSLSNRGEYLVDLGRPAEAVPPLRRALATWETQVGPDHQFLAYPLTALGRAYTALGRPGEAVVALERARSVREAREPDMSLVAETRFALAQALWDAADAGGRGRALSLARRARLAYARKADQPHVAAIDVWLSARGATRPAPTL